MLSIKGIFDICKEHGVYVDISYHNNPYAGMYHYMIKLYYGQKRYYQMLDQTDLDYVFASWESFEKYVCDFLEKQKKRRKTNE